MEAGVAGAAVLAGEPRRSLREGSEGVQPVNVVAAQQTAETETTLTQDMATSLS